MRRSTLLAVFVFSLSSLAVAKTIYQIDLRGNARVLAQDRPVRTGSLLLFHRYPDGLFASIPAAEVVRIVTAEVNPNTEMLQPGETIEVGPTGGHRAEVAAPEGSGATAAAPGPYGPMYPPYYGFGGAFRRARFPRPGMFPAAPPLVAPNGFPARPGTAPPLIGPNGFPILASPNAPGGTPPAIGPNGFPVPPNASRRFP